MTWKELAEEKIRDYEKDIQRLKNSMDFFEACDSIETPVYGLSGSWMMIYGKYDRLSPIIVKHAAGPIIKTFSKSSGELTYSTELSSGLNIQIELRPGECKVIKKTKPRDMTITEDVYYEPEGDCDPMFLDEGKEKKV